MTRYIRNYPEKKSQISWYYSLKTASYTYVSSMYFLSRYNASSGIFTCEHAGLFFFQQHWLTHPSYNPQYMFIMKNGIRQCSSIGKTPDADDFNSPSCGVLMELSVGDQVWVAGGNDYIVACCEYTMFTGFLVQPYVWMKVLAVNSGENWWSMLYHITVLVKSFAHFMLWIFCDPPAGGGLNPI